ncbi:hypothetical protein [Parendozoicomonas sp. Alg238-R29]|uniref:hypothetical protein n=1 Tax=Parendozoicomonas sp. Alg238-R29 TaxID=2993446 RepID=UPI00248D9E9C|nr:hypothetical protein [Parendozoicomonas sp. Alg238-R29]
MHDYNCMHDYERCMDINYFGAMPRLSELMMSASYNMFGESKAALGNNRETTEQTEGSGERTLPPEQRLLMSLLKGVQW